MDPLKRPAHRGIELLAWCPAVVFVAVTVLLRAGGDAWWPVLPFLFGPRWPWAIALVLAAPLVVTRPRKAVAPVAAALVVLGYGVLGFRSGIQRILSADGLPLRVLTYNVARDGAIATRLTRALDEMKVDVAALVECPPRDPPVAPIGWSMRAQGEICVYSRWPIISWLPHPRLGHWRPDGNDSAARLVVDVGGAGPVTIAVVHLETARDALSQFFALRSLLRSAAAIDSQTSVRRNESAAARGWIGHDTITPMIVVGDFNLTIESTIYRRDWSDLANAFDVGGIGLGHTWRSRWHGARIDHVLTNRHATARRAFIGPDFGSDHRPMIADLVIPKQDQRTTVAR